VRATGLLLLLLTTLPSQAGEAYSTEATYSAEQLARTATGDEAPEWQVSNFSYPESSMKLEPLEGGGQALRIGNPNGKEGGRYTVGLRYPWSTEKGFHHEVSVRFAAGYGLQYNSGASFSVAGPGGSGMMNLANGTLLFDQAWGDRLEVPDLTGEVQSVLEGKWNAKALHTYTLRWETTGNTEDVMFDVLVDGEFVKRMPGNPRTLDTRPSLWFSFEYGMGWALIESVHWKMTPSDEVVRRLKEERGTWVLATRGPGSTRMRLNDMLETVPGGRFQVLDFVWTKKNYRLSEYPGEYLGPLYRGFLIAGTPYEAIGPRLTALMERSVRDGARLLVLGGPYAFGKGGYMNTPFEAILPVRSVGPFEIKHFESPMPMEGTAVELPGQAMSVHAYHDIEVSEGAEVLVTAGGEPILVRRRLGRGEVIAFLGFSGGPSPKGYWNQDAWPTWMLRVGIGMPGEQ